jgi:ATP-binding cassette, subfamily B, bacterial
VSMYGTTDEERVNLTKAESKIIRARSNRLLLSLIQPVKKRIAISFSTAIFSQALRVLGPAIIAFGIDSALPALIRDDSTPLILAVGGYLFAALATASLTYFFISFAARINQDVLFDLRQRMFVHTQKLSVEFHERYTSGRVIARQTSDLDSIKELLDTGGNEMIVGTLFMGFTATALILLDPQSALILIASWIPLYFLTRWFVTRAKRLYRESRVASARLIVYFVETMTGIRAVKAFRKEAANRKKYGDLTEDYRDINARVIQLFGIFDPGLILIGNVTLAMVLLFGGARVLDGSLGIGVLTAALLYTRQFYEPIEQIAIFYNSYQSASSALEKISGVLEEDPTVEEPENPETIENPKGEVNFAGVAFHYSNDVPVLHEFDLKIAAGQTIALVGTTGAGKSTLAKLIARFYDPPVGKIELDGVDLRNLSTTDLRKHVVMVTQEAYLFSGTVRQNIELGKPGATDDEIERAARAVGAHDFILSLPDGYDTDVNKRGGRVSSGQRQLISFARAFLADPSVLILDEATSSLDIPSERLVQQGLQTLLKGRTAVIIAHRLSTVSIADRVLVMEHGRIIEDDAPAKLIAGSGKFAQLHKAWRESLV